jgi:hypothetical protein
VITYDGLPKSSGGAHSLGRLDFHEAWARVASFLTTCTDYTVPSDVHFQLGTGKRVSRRFARKTCAKLTLRHSIPTIGNVIGYEETYLDWNVCGHRIQQLIDELASYQPFPDHWLDSPLILAVGACFNFILPETREVLPFQGPQYYLHQAYDGYGSVLGQSKIYLRLTTRSTLSAFFCLPFETPDRGFENYRAFLQEHFPFRLSNHQWRHWELTRQGTSYRRRKVRPLLLTQADRTVSRGEEELRESA